ncbi:subunit Rpb11 of RNA polymerase II [Ordospora colligata]|uniref:Subunit Rpb11 of RNA polymerase II n=1 Tax=Ordospora colligata OC4 TaxID=1354746 RepID=A0A0B2UNP0_9MICR|nr:subunit Rpb11 of RNA polymerase II [Ordospora colligata OC4]KHN70575.1 subunit Rpb11 of RNA polymerase II [Ordospora colligata OC4]TBU17325.1 subunit Rpb11 of RNA polymerase II [Ordospora colligata]TBU17575.1 subunit Rpb11 of RNA polymerase II [Ordospora colligata]TBU19755.1 subunit Rpb11 of RNA polymerase II [Ordospora colligata]
MSDQSKVLMSYVGSTRNTVELKIYNETHTLGSMLSERLLEDKRCLFSAYKIDHPTDSHLLLRITAEREYPVKNLLLDTLRKIEEDTASLIYQLKEL